MFAKDWHMLADQHIMLSVLTLGTKATFGECLRVETHELEEQDHNAMSLLEYLLSSRCYLLRVVCLAAYVAATDDVSAMLDADRRWRRSGGVFWPTWRDC
jgi:hypothetical protein